ncbi:MAG: ferritin family protein [Desulfobacterales bacterium]|nr:ferritin family protein [Desulfobacterales bacterium]
MEGGIRAWQGLVAEGIPEAGMAYFSSTTRPEEMIGLAWLLEDGSRKFYESLAKMMEDQETKGLFENLKRSEGNHKTTLWKMYEELSGKPPTHEFPDTVISAEPRGDVMEGGMSVSEALKWSEGKELKDILELSISLESNSYDLYLKMERKTEGHDAKQVFKTLSEEEKNHLEQLTSLFNRRPGKES